MKEINFTRIEKIKEFRLAKVLTQEHFANIADVNTSHISNIENNHTKISLFYPSPCQKCFGNNHRLYSCK